MKRRKRARRITRWAGLGALVVILFGAWFWQDLKTWVLFVARFESFGRNSQGHLEYRHRRTGIIMVRVPGGVFQMGASPGDLWAFHNETPRHAVRLRPFLIAKYEISRDEWDRAFPDDDRDDSSALTYVRPGTTSPVPLDGLSWIQCRGFSEQTALSMPTEAQWEFACRAGSTGLYGGTGSLAEMGWCASDQGTALQRRGRKEPNAFGLFDMHGNLDEWCQDGLDHTFYRDAVSLDDPVCETNPTGQQVLRGGAWNRPAWYCRSSARYGAEPSAGGFGFRPAYSPVP